MSPAQTCWLRLLASTCIARLHGQCISHVHSVLRQFLCICILKCRINARSCLALSKLLYACLLVQKPLRCTVKNISFSAHADFEQTSGFLNAVRPPHVVLVHGEREGMMRWVRGLLCIGFMLASHSFVTIYIDDEDLGVQERLSGYRRNWCV